MKPQRFVLAIPFLLASCSLSPIRGSSSSDSQGIESPSISSSIPQESSSSSVEAPVEVDTPFTEEALRFFDATDVSMNIAFTPEALRFMSDYQSDQKKYDDVYLPAEVSIRFEGKDYVYPDAGVRMKGNTSRRKIYNEDGVVANLVHFKVTFKETFDDDIYSDELLQGFARDWSEDADGRKARKKRNFLGLSKLDLKYVTRNTSTGGDCILREIYAYRAFEKAGVPTPKAGLTTLTFGDGVTSLTSHYETVETIDKDFLKRRYSKAEAKGDLYKCVYGPMGKGDLSRSGAIDYVIDENGYCSGKAILRGKIGVENNYEYYNPCYDLKTNDDGDNSDFSSMANFIANMWNLVYAGAPATLLESTLHVDEFLRYSALAYLIGNFDDARFNYNNYYVYFLPSTGQAIYIPYDYDWCLGLEVSSSSGVAQKDVNPFSPMTFDGGEAASVFYATFFDQNKSNSKLSYDRKPYQDAYSAYIKQYLDSTLNPAAFEELTSKYGRAEELGNVSSYMNAKRATVNRFYGK